MAWVLGVATFLGGVAAVFYFVDMWRENRRWTEREKEVNSAWWETSALRAQYEGAGYRDFAWSNSDRVAARLQNGMKIVYEIDDNTKTKYKLVNRNGQVLLGRSGV